MVTRLDIAMIPAEAARMTAPDCYIVIDALRATTVQAVLFHRGLASMRVVSQIAAARDAASPGVLLFGEEGGLPPQDFHHGNSPVEAANLDVHGRHAVHFTTNGTVALCTVASRGPTYTGSLVNLSAVAEAAFTADHVVVVCSGNARGTVFSLEDFAVATAFVQRLAAGPNPPALGDAALLALSIADPAALIPRSHHAEIVRGLGLHADIDFACRLDAAPSVPFVTAFGDGWATLENRR